MKPVQETSSPLDNPRSLLRVIERMLISFQPFVAPNLVNSDDAAAPPDGRGDGGSVERQCMRWAFGVVRNLCMSSSSTATSTTTARWIGETQIPLIALQVIRYTPSVHNYQRQWHPQSLEDLALGLWVELALREEEHSHSHANSNHTTISNNNKILCPALHSIGCQDYLQPLIHANAGGIHSVRARAIVKRFDGVDLMADSWRRSSKNGGVGAGGAAAAGGTRSKMATTKKKEDGYHYVCDSDLETSTMASV